MNVIPTEVAFEAVDELREIAIGGLVSAEDAVQVLRRIVREATLTSRSLTAAHLLSCRVGEVYHGAPSTEEDVLMNRVIPGYEAAGTGVFAPDLAKASEFAARCAEIEAHYRDYGFKVSVTAEDNAVTFLSVRSGPCWDFGQAYDLLQKAVVALGYHLVSYSEQQGPSTRRGFATIAVPVATYHGSGTSGAAL